MDKVNQDNIQWYGRYKPGHYYSPIPDLLSVQKRKEELFSNTLRIIPGINVQSDKQLELISNLKQFQIDIPFSNQPIDGLRYHYINRFFSHTDAIILHSLLRFFKPTNIIEVGSGYSSAVILDTNDLFFNGSIDCSFIEPYPERLLSLVDYNEVKLFDCRIEEAPLSLFKNLNENDILFIDSSHVCKVGSDVNYLFETIFPSLQEGVIIHIHDIFYPFEYPQEWIDMGRYWNEAYILRSFLQFNDTFEIILWNDYLAKFHSQKVTESIPLFMNFIDGTAPRASIWLKKLK